MKNNLIGYYVLTLVTIISLVFILITKSTDLLFYYWVLMIWWPAKTAEILLKKNGKFTKNSEAWLGVAFVIVFWLIVAFLVKITHLPAL